MPVDYAALRNRMVESQIAARNVKDERVLAAMREVPRHLFVPELERRRAHADGPLPIGFGQTISQPYIVALMSELCELSGVEKVLEVGTGSGYQAAVLSRLAREVWSIEIVPQLHERSRELLAGLGCANVHCLLGDGSLGHPSGAPYDVILLAAAPLSIPNELTRQLEPDGGILVAPEGSPWEQMLVRLRLSGGRLEREEVIPVRFVPLVGRS